MVKKASDGYIKACSFPAVTSARFEAGSNALLTATYSQKCPEIGKKRQFSKIFSTTQTGQVLATMPMRGEATDSISAHGKNDVSVTISKLKSFKGEDVNLLEVWNQGQISQTLNLTEVDLHGAVYYDSELGGLVMNSSNTKVAFIAEAKKPKNVPFFPTKKSPNNDTLYGREYTFQEEWGEQLVGKSQSVVVVVDLPSLSVDVLREEFFPDNLSPGQLQWAGENEIIGIVVDSLPYRLGLIYCTNRPSGLFKLNLVEHTFDIIKVIFNLK